MKTEKEINEEGVKIQLLNVWMREGNERIEWHFGDLPNCYFLLRVLDVIKDELIHQINEASEK